MSRLAAQADLNYVPAPTSVVDLIATHIAPSPVGTRLLDVCAGEGSAAAQLARGVGIERSGLWLNELHGQRAQQCRAVAPPAQVMGGDALADLQISRHFCQLLYLNPPFAWQGREQGSERLELHFFQRAVEQGQWLQADGVAVYICPERVARRPTVVRHFARCFDHVAVWAFPLEQRRFSEVVIFGVRRSEDRQGHALLAEVQRLETSVLLAPLPLLQTSTVPSYELPLPVPLPSPHIFRLASMPDPLAAARDVAAMDGAWASPQALTHMERMRRTATRRPPLFPLNPTQAALQIAAGAINNQAITVGKRIYLLKGSAVEAVHAVERTLDSGTAKERHETRRTRTRTPRITLVDTASGAISIFIGAQGMQALLDMPGMTDALLQALERTNPARYTLTLPQELRPLFARFVPQSGRTLPGQVPGLTPMQQHLVAALWTAMQGDQDRGQRPLHRVLFGASMGTGKSVMGLALAEALRVTSPAPQNRAWTVILPAPTNLIGTRGQFDPLPQWWAEAADVLGGWYLEILETPAQVARFFQHAKTEPQRPHLGFVGFSAASLACGWDHATTLRRSLPAEQEGNPRRQQYLALLDAGTQADGEHVQKLRQETTRMVQRMYHPNGDGDDTLTTPSFGPGVSPRTLKRDIIGRAGHAGRTAPLPTWGRHTCPDCGRPVPVPEREAGMGNCAVCDARLGTWVRRQDSVPDRGLRVFRSLDARTWATDTDGQRAIPWGERPQSNPRWPLGTLIDQRYGDQVDLLLIDEVHEAAARDSAIATAIGHLIAHCRRTLAMSGTPGNGYASSLFWLSKRLNLQAVDDYGWEEVSRFSRELGVIEEIERERLETRHAQTLRGNTQTTYTIVDEKPGITAELASRLAASSVCISLEAMGYAMPPYDEQLVPLTMPPEVANAYAELEEEGRAILREEDGHDALGSYLHALLCWPLAPWSPRSIESHKAGLAYTPEPLDRNLVLPHHNWLVEAIAPALYERRRTILFLQHVRSVGLVEDLLRKLPQLLHERHGLHLRAAVLRSSTCAAGLRGAWFKGQEERGTMLVLTHPRLVGVGMNLVGWPNLTFLEPPYELIRALQARRRSWRPTQTQAVNVRWLGYEGTLGEQALDIVGRKALASGLLMGDDVLGGGLYVADEHLSLLHALAERVRSGASQQLAVRAVAEQLQAAGEQLVARTRSAAWAFDPRHIVTPSRARVVTEHSSLPLPSFPPATTKRPLPPGTEQLTMF
jgi:hypothetical protein